MSRLFQLVLLSAMLTILTGCLERTITVTSEPPGAIVYLNDEEIGRTPVTVPFTFYGTYDVRLTLPGYKVMAVAQQAKTPWYEIPGPDLIAEALPGKTLTELKWHYKLEPAQPVSEDALLDRASQLRAKINRED